MRLIGAMILGCALMVGSADASHHCEASRTPVRITVSKVVEFQPVRTVLKRIRCARPVKRWFGWNSASE